MTTSTELATAKESTASDTPKAASSRRESFVKPSFHITNGESEHRVEIHVPGSRKKDITISLEDKILEVTARRSVAVPESWTPVHRESRSEDYRLRLRVSSPVDEAGIKAKVSNGVLALTLPVREETPPRTIEVG